ncbi:DNA repair protein RadC [Oscillatoria amoena NRMC-F 0135]|nr:DNA repair protein RadC [Oscillatoria laete-virens]MDL5047513.1 DNA repair protein RadC [Oscillatoria amoena NRMC-F 0135]MDL5054662.1 DNA repair protein RadC [Oscillatoria laete-virens NRMC-F 0139]
MKPIAKIDKQDRPREKLEKRGPAALTDEELVACILGMGMPGRDVSVIARDVAKEIREHRTELALDHLKGVPGMGLAKAAQILSAFELARRHLIRDTVKVTKPEDVLPLLEDIRGKLQEHFVCVTLNGAHEIIEKRIVTIGLLNQSQIHPREVFADALTDRAAAVIFAHNHPSGNLEPSTADIAVQRQLESAARILGLRVLDHLIVSKKGFYSFQEHGLIQS